MSRREGPQAGGAAELTGGLGNSGLSDHKPTAPPLGSANVLLGLGARRGGKGLCREAWPPGGSQAPGLTSLSPRLFCGCPGAEGATRRAPGRRKHRKAALCASRAPPSGQSRNWRSETQRVAQASPMAANHGRPLSTLTNHNSQVHFRPITQQHMVAEPIRTRDLKTRGLRPAPRCHPTEAVPNAWSLSLGAFEQSLGRALCWLHVAAPRGVWSHSHHSISHTRLAKKKKPIRSL